MNKWFKDRKLYFVTNHKKDEVFKDVFLQKLLVEVVGFNSLNTDKFGSFTGEVKRKKDMISTCRNKILEAKKVFDHDLFVSSEGSFVSDSLGVLVRDFEVLMFKDFKNDFEIVVSGETYKTNCLSRKIYSIDDLVNFVNAVGFPRNGIILKSFRAVYKDFVDIDHLYSVYDKIKSSLFVKYIVAETDMRADKNEFRMNFLKEMASKSVNVLSSECPSCSAPGFQIKNYLTGKLCRLCLNPTNEVSFEILGCCKCDFSLKKKNDKDGDLANPLNCNFCNP